MRNWLYSVLLLALPTLAQADDPRCLLSFDSARLDTCTGEVKLASEALAPLADLDGHAGSPLRLVKFDGPIDAGQRQALEARGARIIGYAPHHAFLVRMAPALDASVRTIPGVTWTGPFLPAFKVDVNIANDLGGTDIVRAGGVHSLTVALHPDADAATARSALQAAPGVSFRFTEQGHDHQRVVLSFEHARLDQAVAFLAGHDDVTSVSLRWDAEFMNSQAGWLHQSGTNTGPSQLPIFERGLFGCGQVVAAADSGLHAANCSFADAGFGTPVTSVCATGSSCTATTPDFNHRKVGAHYKWDGSTSGGPADGHGHGTHVMGSMAGNNPAGAVDCDTFTSPGGLTNLDGTAPGAKIISQEMGASLQYLNSLGGTIYHAASIAYQNGARIHNNSWGSSCRTGLAQTCIAGCQVEYRQTTRDADAMVWEFPEMALFVAAGNSGGLGGNAGCGPGADVGSAGNAKNVFSIGSNNRGTGGDNMSGFSSRGPTQDRRSKPDLTAQGASIVSASRTACGTTSMSGTSMATPTAAGLAALVRDYLARGFYPGGTANAGNAIGNPSAALVKAIMITGARSITGSGTTGGAPSQSQGWGRIHLDDALYFAGDSRNLWLHDGTAGLQTGGTDNHTLAVTAGQPLVVTLTWHDAPALVNANPHTVNLLRLEVQAPNGDVWTQKLPATGGLSNPNPLQDTTTSNYDNVNNVHQIRIASPQAGTWQVRVRGIQVAQGPQPYALAATGALTGVTNPDFQLQATPGSFALCAGDNASVAIGALGLEGFDDAVTLSLAGLPGPATGSFSANPVTPANPAATSTLTLANTGGLPAGPLNLTVNGQSSGPGFPATSRSVDIAVTVSAGTPAASTPATPASGATGQPLQPAFTWSAVAGADGYRFELATDPGFGNVVIDTTVPGTSFSPAAPLANSTDYWWRVTASNTCGSSAASAVFSFRTLGQPGECDAGATPVDVFTEDFSGGLGGFSTAGSTGASTWAISTVRPSPLSGGNAVLATNIAT
ncbi:MAG: S8 family serine peptidase, partial [Pseudoxanthomonas sp.]|nr:S8 family serine peptidase [Pseudoxanthomonas sp.]